MINIAMKCRVMTMLLIICTMTMSAQEKADTLKRQKQNELIVTCTVADHMTHDAMSADTLRGELLNAADSSFVDTLKIESMGWGAWKQTNASVTIKQPGSYLLRFLYMGYQPKYVPLLIKKLYKNEIYRELKPVYMQKQKTFTDMELDEVVVKATKLKFYMDGDTLVYDADAFSMAEGSMLGQLIKKLPGVEIEKGGEIKVNGKKVDAMLLNGKDFFDSDRELLLENMPTYMVKNIQSYERVPESVKGTNKEKNAKKELVMNVKLKREYNTGWLVSLSGGAGSTFFKNNDGKLSTKYLGRLFATRFDDRSRIILYGGVNNVNDSQSPGDGGEYSDLSQTTGITDTYHGGMNFYSELTKNSRYMGSVNASYTDTESQQGSSSETFLEGGSTFGRSFSKSNAQAYTIGTNHMMFMDKSNNESSWYKKVHFSVSPSFNYSKNNSKGSSSSLTLAKDVANELGKAWVDSIMAPNAGEIIRKYAINRSLSSSYSRGHNLSTGANADINYTPAHNDIFDFSTRVNYNYSDGETNQFNHDSYEYPNSPSVKSDFRNKYSPNFNRSHTLSVAPSFTFLLDKKWGNMISLNYNYDYAYRQSNQSLYLLNKLDEWGAGTPHALGNLPSMDEMLQTLDRDNSSESTTTNNNHNVSLSVMHNFVKEPNDDKFSMISASLNMPVSNEKIDYKRGVQVDTLLTRTTVFFNPSLSYSYDEFKKFKGFEVSYSMSMSAPSLMSMISFVDTSNPLVESHNNPNLKNTTNHNFNTTYRSKFGRTFFYFNGSANITQNQVASGFVLNKDTGKRIVTPENVNGNWNANASTTVSYSFDKDEKWRMMENVNYMYTNSVDLSGSTTSADEAEAKATRSVVGSHNISDRLELNYRHSDKMEFSAVGNITYQNSTSERKDFTSINAFDFNYGATAKVELPLNFQVSTDITMYSRRGYSDNTMNTNELVWNLRLAKKLMKGSLIIQADGFDILGNLSNIRRTINAQGRTETFSNVIPSYFLVHLTYKFNKYPKK